MNFSLIFKQIIKISQIALCQLRTFEKGWKRKQRATKFCQLHLSRLLQRDYTWNWVKNEFFIFCAQFNQSEGDLEWDDHVGALIANNFQHWMDSLKLLSSPLEPRYLAKDSFQQVYLHLFCDESGLAYGVAIYARTTSDAGIHIIRRCWRLSGEGGGGGGGVSVVTPMFYDSE